MKWNVLVSCIHLQKMIDQYRHIFEKHEIDIDLPEVVQQLEEDDLLKIIDRYDGVIAGDDRFTSKVLEKASRLKVIAKWGVGVDAIDQEAAKRRGIRVVNTPNVFGDEVADVVIGYIIMLARQLHTMDQSVRKGGWLKVQGSSLNGKTLGVVGVGSIGKSVIRRARALGMKTIGYDILPVSDSIQKELELSMVELDEVFRISDFISLNSNATRSNRHLINARTLDLMKKGVCIINTSRGVLIDEAALVQSLKQGKVAGAALDVFEVEPLPMDSPLRGFDNVVLGTHNSSNTIEAVMRVNERAIQNLLDGLERKDA